MSGLPLSLRPKLAGKFEEVLKAHCPEALEEEKMEEEVVSHHENGAASGGGGSILDRGGACADFRFGF